MFRQHTDEGRLFSTDQHCAMVEAEGITCDHRTLSEDIDILNANGFEVHNRRTRYTKLYYIVDRQFELAEEKSYSILFRLYVSLGKLIMDEFK